MILVAGGVLAATYGLIVADLWFRAREAYRQGEKYWQWHFNPEDKKAFLDQDFEKRKHELGRLLSRKRITEANYRERLELASFDHDEAIKESSIKYAYIWYQTVIELFSPPESRWVRKAREKLPQAKELWKKELTQLGIPFEDYMLE